jgi:hypothetical protein
LLKSWNDAAYGKAIEREAGIHGYKRCLWTELSANDTREDKMFAAAAASAPREQERLVSFIINNGSSATPSREGVIYGINCPEEIGRNFNRAFDKIMYP